MRTTRSHAIAGVIATTLLLGSCSDTPADSGEQADGEPARGGTLRLAGPEDIDFLDPTGAIGPSGAHMMRALIRPLFSFPSSNDLEESTELVADAAAEIPTVDNGGISADGLTYTVSLREGVLWHAEDGDRQVVAQDAVRAIKRLCNPRLPSPQLGEFLGLIAGLEDYCAGFAEVEPTAEAIRAYVEDNEIAGVQAPDEETVVYTLEGPSSEFLNKLALTPAAPQPAEYLQYVPDSPELRQNTVSNGPYMIESYTPGQSFTLVRNPAWDPDTDDVREGYVDRIEISAGQDDASVFQQINAGTLDMQWGDANTPTSEVPALVAAEDPRMYVGSNGTINPFLSLNVVSPNEDSALSKLEVRQALNYAVNKQAIIQNLGGPQIAQVHTQILPPVSAGYQEIDPFETPDSEGDPERARQLLADAGYPDGLTLKLIYREDGIYPPMAAIFQQDLALAGITLELQSTNRNSFYGQYLQNPEAVMAGAWDIGITGTNPGALFGSPSTYFEGNLDGRTAGAGSPNFGMYNNDELNDLMDAASTAETRDEALELWAEADQLATEDAPWVPVAVTSYPVFRGERVENAVFNATWHNFDLTMAWVQE